MIARKAPPDLERGGTSPRARREPLDDASLSRPARRRTAAGPPIRAPRSISCCAAGSPARCGMHETRDVGGTGRRTRSFTHLRALRRSAPMTRGAHAGGVRSAHGPGPARLVSHGFSPPIVLPVFALFGLSARSFPVPFAWLMCRLTARLRRMENPRRGGRRILSRECRPPDRKRRAAA